MGSDLPRVMDIDEARRLKEGRPHGGGRKQTGARYVVPEPPFLPGPSQEEPPPPPEPHQWTPSMLVEQGGYDPDAFYTSASIGDEGTTQVNVTVSKTMMYLLGAIVQSGRLPDIKVSQDAFRDALAHWLHKRSHRLPPHIQAEINEGMQRHVYLSRMEAKARARAEVQQVLDVTEKELDEARRANDRQAYVNVVESAKVQRKSMTGPGHTSMGEIIERAERELERWRP